jgi:hypothetical protein
LPRRAYGRKKKVKDKHSLGIQFQILFTRIPDQEKLRVRERIKNINDSGALASCRSREEIIKEGATGVGF